MKKYTEHIFLFLVMVTVLQPPCQAQQFQNNFQKLTTKDGLSQNDIKALHQGQFGYMWIGTNDGLNRYDGYEIKTFRKDIYNANSLASNLISCIAEDSLGNIWIGTDDHGVSMYDRNSNQFRHFGVTPNDPISLSNPHISAILVDTDGYIWIGTRDGLNKLTIDYETGQTTNQIFKVDPKDFRSIKSNEIITLYQDQHENIWVGSKKGLSYYYDNRNKDKSRFIHFDEITGFVSSIAETETGLLIDAFYVFELPFAEISKTNPKFRKIIHANFRELFLYDKNTILGASFQGISVWENVGGSYLWKERIKHNWGNPSSLSNDIINCILRDKSGLIWIGTDGGGVNIYNPNKRNFRHFTRTENPGSISHNRISSLFEDSQKNLWVGTRGYPGLSYLEPSKYGQYDHGFKHVEITPITSIQTNVYAMGEYTKTDEPLLLLGCNYSALFKYGPVSDVKKGKFFEGEGYIQVNDPVYAILIDQADNIWIGTYHGGLYRYKIDSQGKVLSADTFCVDKNNPKAISSNIIRSMAQDHDGNIWIGTANGLNKLVPGEQSKQDPFFTKYFHNSQDQYTISHNYILPILVTKNGEIWIGTLGGGINKVLSAEGSDNDYFLTYNTADGLPNNSIKSILEDDKGYIWCTSNKGLTRFSPEKLEFQNFGLDDGLQDVEFSELAAYKKSDGELLFGGVDGFNALYPKEIKRDTFNVDMAFDDLYILNKKISPGDTLNGRVVLKSNINKARSIRLLYEENSFSIRFSTLHYVYPAQNKYAYKLEGFDDGWIYTNASNRIAKYTNLSPGEYTLKVKATNSDEHWSKNQLGLKILIETPWWASDWAIALYALAVIIGLWFFRKYTIITNTRKNELLLEHMEKEKLEELSQLKLKFFTNISHEFRTPLTLIIGFVERLRNLSPGLNEKDKQRYYQNIMRNSKTLLNLINQLMGFRKLEQEKMNLRVSYNDLSNYISLLGENFYELANQKDIDFNVVCKERVLVWFDPEVMERVIFNLLSNAFKFTPNGGKITLELYESKGHIHIVVKDNGLGIPEDIQAHLFERFANANIKGETGSGIGLSFIKSLIEMHHGSISYETKENHGTTFKVALPIDRDTYTPEEIMGGSNSLEIEKDDDWLLPLEHENKKIPRKSSFKNHSLLLVEDNDDILLYLEETFKSHYIIFKANEGKEALDICLENSIDLVISDVMMGGMGGFEFCEKLKSDERINHIPIILLTAKDNTESKLKGYALGADAYIVKPFSMEELQTRLEALIESRQRIASKFKSSLYISPSDAGLTSIDEKFLNRVMTFIEEQNRPSKFY